MHINEPPPSPRKLRSDLPPAIDRVIEIALAKNRDNRFSSAGELAEAFRTALSGTVPLPRQAGAPLELDSMTLQEIAVAAPSGSAERSQRLIRLNRPVLVGGGVLAAALVLLGIWLVVFNRGTTPTPVVPASSAPTLAVGAASVPPSATRAATQVVAFQPSNTPVLPSATPMPPSATPIPPSATRVATQVATQAVALQPSNTPVPPSATPLPPIVTTAPPSATPLPPSATPTPPSATPLLPTPAPASPALPPGTLRTDPGGIVQVWVPAGCFQMGSDPAKDKAAAKEEQPMHEVCITHSFWLDQFLVTNAAFDKFVKDGGYTKNEYWSPDGWKWLQANRIKGPQNASKFSDPNHPRIGVSWYEADAYARWRGGRLPTEAEWEYAARGPKSPIYPWGDTWDKTKANVNSAGVTVVVTYEKGKSWVGAYDMSGNVWQWVADWYLDTYYLQKVKDDPQGPPSTGSHTLRGGAWDYTETYARSANRYDLAPDSRGFDIGFRVVISAP